MQQFITALQWPGPSIFTERVQLFNSSHSNYTVTEYNGHKSMNSSGDNVFTTFSLICTLCPSSVTNS